MKPLYIFDLDGTLALIEHRRHIIEDKSNKDDSKWRKFYSLCDQDKPNRPVIGIFSMLLRNGADCWIFSGRSDEVRAKTEIWIDKYTVFSTYMSPDVHLVMRREGDSTPDQVLKQQWLNDMLEEDRKRLVATFDDRDRVVDMWRSNGINCFQVAPGGF